MRRLLSARHRIKFQLWRAVTSLRLRRQGVECRITAGAVPPRFSSVPTIRVTGRPDPDRRLDITFADGVWIGRGFIVELAGGQGSVELGENSRVADGVHFRLQNRGGVRAGRESDIRTGVVVRAEAELWIGDDVVVSYRACLHVAHGIRIGDHCGIGSHVTMADSDHTWSPLSSYRAETIPGPIVLEDNVLILANCVIGRSVHLPSGVMVAAGSVVRAGDWKPGTLIAGAPATERRTLG